MNINTFEILTAGHTLPHSNTLHEHVAVVSSVCGRFELLQLSSVFGALRHLFPPLVEFSGNLLKTFALSLGDAKIRKQSEAEKQHGKQDEHVAVQPSLEIKKNKKERKMKIRSPHAGTCLQCACPSCLPVCKERSCLWWSCWSSCSSQRGRWPQAEAPGWTAQPLWTTEWDRDRSQRSSRRGRSLTCWRSSSMWIHSGGRSTSVRGLC